MDKIPLSMGGITGETSQCHDKIEEFFIDTRKAINDLDLYFEIRVKNHKDSEDERTHMLLYKEQVIATVIETRTEFNNVRYDFFRNLEGKLNNQK